MFTNFRRAARSLVDSLRYIGEQLGPLQLIVVQLAELNESMRLREQHAAVKVSGRSKAGDLVTLSKPCASGSEEGIVVFDLTWGLTDVWVRIEGDAVLVSVVYGQAVLLDGPALAVEAGSLTLPGAQLACRWQRLRP